MRLGIRLQIKSYDQAIISKIERPLAKRIEIFLHQLEEKNETLHLSDEYFNTYKDLWHGIMHDFYKNSWRFYTNPCTIISIIKFSFKMYYISV